jgi:hypothetical protein
MLTPLNEQVNRRLPILLIQIHLTDLEGLLKSRDKPHVRLPPFLHAEPAERLPLVHWIISSAHQSFQCLK